MKSILYCFAALLSMCLIINTCVAHTGTLAEWPANCSYQYQGRDFIPNIIGDETDCNKSTVAFPGETPPQRCLKIRYHGYKGDGSYRIINKSNNTYFVPMNTAFEWDSFVKTLGQNNIELESCVVVGKCGVASHLPTPPFSPPSAFRCEDGNTTKAQLIVSDDGFTKIWSWMCEGTPLSTENNVSCNTAPASAVE